VASPAHRYHIFVITDAVAPYPRDWHRPEKKVTRSSTTEVTPSVEHAAEAPTFMTVDGKPLQKTRKRKRSPGTEKAPSKQARPLQMSRERPVPQPIGPSEPLPQPSSFKVPERTSYMGLDRTFKANLARLTWNHASRPRASLF
jgi:hypothetical protein